SRDNTELSGKAPWKRGGKSASALVIASRSLFHATHSARITGDCGCHACRLHTDQSTATHSHLHTHSAIRAWADGHALSGWDCTLRVGQSRHSTHGWHGRHTGCHRRAFTR